jgi:hypothetical protein
MEGRWIGDREMGRGVVDYRLRMAIINNLNTLNYIQGSIKSICKICMLSLLIVFNREVERCPLEIKNKKLIPYSSG